MKKIYIKIAMILAGGTFIFIIMLVLTTAYSHVQQNVNNLKDILLNIEQNIEKYQSNYQKQLQQWENDYLHRSESIAYMIQEVSHTSLYNERLLQLKDLMEVETVSLLDEDGQIIYSSDTHLINNIDSYTLEQYQNFKDEQEDYRFIIEETDFMTSPALSYFFLKVSSPYYQTLCLKMNLSPLFSESQIITNVLHDSSTDYQTSILAIDHLSGSVFAITENNKQDFLLKQEYKSEEVIEWLNSQNNMNWSIIDINQSKYLAKILHLDHFSLVALRDIDFLFHQMIYRIVSMILFSGIVGSMIIGALYYLLKKSLFDDLLIVNHQIQEMTLGHYHVVFPPCHLSELETTVQMIRVLKQGLINKNERMNKIFGSISPHIAVFECLDMESSNFYSMHLWDILHIDKDVQDQFIKKPMTFRQFIMELASQKNSNNIVLYQGSYLEIHVYEIQDELVGVIIDRTKEEQKTLALKASLNNEKKKHHLDDLTGALSRTGFKKEINNFLHIRLQGVLMLFDLDHFKNINDSLGHPAGDQILITFYQYLCSTFRQSDVIGRLGGDEFVVFLPNIVNQDSLETKLLQMMIETKELFKKYEKYGLSVSIGVAIVSIKMGISNYEELYKSADSALYIAKRLGRNCYYINYDGIRCMVSNCQYCRKECARRDILGLDKRNDQK